jgi:Family of unknown function (DUF5678)
MAITKPLVTSQDAEKYAGNWVLLRKGEVVYASPDLDQVLAARQERFDSVAKVPEQQEVFY